MPKIKKRNLMTLPKDPVIGIDMAHGKDETVVTKPVCGTCGGKGTVTLLTTIKPYTKVVPCKYCQ